MIKLRRLWVAGVLLAILACSAPMIFVAMFKVATSQDQVLAGSKMVTLDMDGCKVQSDWYLRLGGDTGRMLRGEILLTAKIPIQPWGGFLGWEAVKQPGEIQYADYFWFFYQQAGDQTPGEINGPEDIAGDCRQLVF